MTEIEKYVLDYFGMKEFDTNENTVIKTDYGQIVNLLSMFNDKIKLDEEYDNGKK